MHDIDNAIVQLFVQNAAFNWLEPYKSPEQMSSTGTAFFIDEQGYLLTNYHVVSEASGVQMQMQVFGKQRLDLEVVGIYPERDLALLRLTDASFALIKEQLGSIPYMVLGDSDMLERAQEVSCLGFPLGQETLKITQGIVSGYQEFGADFFIQVTAALNPGNSGGPTLDSLQRVIGINTAIIPDAQNVGYILPINEIKPLIAVLKKQRLIRRPLFGCQMQYGTEDLLTYLNNPQPGGVYIRTVYPKSNAANAGFLVGDMMYSINNHTIDLFGEIETSTGKMPIISWINRCSIGQSLRCLLYRNGRKIETNITLSSDPILPVCLRYPEVEVIDYEVLAGVVFMELSLNHIAFFEDKNADYALFRKQKNQYESLVIVTNIIQNSLAQKTRIIEPGDIIASINDQKITTLTSLRNAFEKNQKYHAIKTSDEKLLVFSFDSIKDDEVLLAQQYMYPIAACIKKLL